MGKLIEDVMSDRLPQGVFAEVYGAGDVGWKLANDDVGLIWFTGSTTVGQQLYKLAGEKFIKAVLELGGSNPGIVFEDADIDMAVEKIYARRMRVCGQTCDALKRLIVHESIFGEVVQKLKDVFESKKIGDPSDLSTDLGSLAAERQRVLLEDQVKDAVDNGATIVTGGARPENLDGAYYLPTILTGVTRDMKVWKEEVFGPVLVVVPFGTEEAALRLGNDTEYGLGSLVFSKDLERAQRVASQLEAGGVEINKPTRWLSCNPFGGYKKSGMGREMGVVGFRELCQIKVISMGK